MTLCPFAAIRVASSSTTISMPPSREGMRLWPIIAILTITGHPLVIQSAGIVPQALCRAEDRIV